MTASQKYRLTAQIRNRDYVDGIKADGICADCEHWFPPCAMDFDHVTGQKAQNISFLVGSGASLERLNEELDKCDLVCACCHRVRTAERIGRAKRKAGKL